MSLQNAQTQQTAKKVYLSFVPKELVNEIANSPPVSYYAIRKRIGLKQQTGRIKELRSNYATYLRQHSIMAEIVGLFQDRIEAKNVQLAHYLKIADMKALSQQILDVTSKMERDLLS